MSQDWAAKGPAGVRREGNVRPGPVTFIVRVAQDEAGRVRAIVERVKTGEKEQTPTLEDIGHVIAGMFFRRESGEESRT